MFIEMTATGHYSGATESEMVWIDDALYEKYEHQINEICFYFHDLDGKHSETKGELYIHETLTEGLAEWKDCTGSDIMMDYITEFMTPEDCEELIARHHEVVRDIKFVTKITAIMNGVEIEL